MLEAYNARKGKLGTEAAYDCYLCLPVAVTASHVTF